MSDQIEEVEIINDKQINTRHSSGIVGGAKPKKQLSEQQLLNLKKARERAQERKTELKHLHAKSKALKEEQLKLDALEYDKLKKEEELKKLKQKELDDIVNKQLEKQQSVNEKDEPKKKKKIKKIIYEDSSDEEEVETVIVRKKKETQKETQIEKPVHTQQRQPTFNDLANMSIQNQIHKKLNEEKFNSLYAQLVGCRY